jgi:hypothetical protein
MEIPMTPDQLFSLAGGVALACWAVLILAPRRWAGLGVVPRWAGPIALSILYAAIVPAHFAGTGGGYGSIAEVRRLFSSDAMLLGGWVHYLAFDLVVGAVLADRMDRAGVHRVVQAAPLAAVFLFGPIGFVLGLVTEVVTRRATLSARSAS